MSTYTIPAGVDVPSEVGATIHLAVPGEHASDYIDRTNAVTPPSVLAALVQKKCETCKGSSLDLSPESIMRTFAKRMDGAPPGSVGVDDCPDCAGSGFDLLDLVRECGECGGDGHGATTTHGRRYMICPTCGRPGRRGTGIVSLGRWKGEALLPVVDIEGLPSTSVDLSACVQVDPDGLAWFWPEGCDDEHAVGLITVLGTPEPGGYVATLTLVVAP